MAKKYTGSLTLDWFNKQKSILVQADEVAARPNDLPAPKMKWINKDEALFYEIVDEKGKGLSPYWVDRSDLRVKEARPLIFQKAYKAVEQQTVGSLLAEDYGLVESTEDDPGIKNILIRGDNLLALNTLKKLFINRPDEEKVKCVFIDPPYNTGSAFEQYDDNLAHSEWLTLIRDRLDILKSLLKENGSLWVTLDDSEVHYFKVMADEVFGASNFIASVIWQKIYTVKNTARHFSDMHDYVLVYAKNSEVWEPNLLPRTGKQDEAYSNPDNDPRGDWKATPIQARNYYSKGLYPVTSPSGRIIEGPPKGTYWRFAESKFRELNEDNRIWWGKNADSIPAQKRFLSEVKAGVVPATIWFHTEAGQNAEAKTEIRLLTDEDENIFTTPKPERLLQRVLQIATNERDLVLDYFGGSGTTFAVAHKMNRRWIGVEIGKHAETHIIPRLKKVLTGQDQSGISKAVNWHGGGSFKYYTLGDSIIDSSTREFNWRLGRDFIEKSLLSSYDFVPDAEFSVQQFELVQARQQPAIGFHRVGQRQMACVVSLNEPNKNEPITYDEFMSWYDVLKKFKGTQSITVFTNRGVELAYDSKPDDLEVIKVPHAIFAELEK